MALTQTTDWITMIHYVQYFFEVKKYIRKKQKTELLIQVTKQSPNLDKWPKRIKTLCYKKHLQLERLFYMDSGTGVDEKSV